MKKIITFFCTVLTFHAAVKCQEYRYVYYLDASLRSVEKNAAVIIGKGLKEDNNFRLDGFAVKGNILLFSIHCSDSSLSDLQGLYTTYHANGRREKEGNYTNGLKEGIWQEWDSAGRKVDSSLFKQDRKILSGTFEYHKNNLLSRSTLKDSLSNTYQAFSFNETGILLSEVFFKGEKGIIKMYDSTGINTKTDSLFSNKEIEASFPGGPRGWENFLRQNLNPATPADNNAPSGTYTVIVRFVVKKDGKVEDVVAETHLGYGMEEQVVRIIKRGPDWLPATQYGRKVNAYRRQPVTFVVAN